MKYVISVWDIYGFQRGKGIVRRKREKIAQDHAGWTNCWTYSKWFQTFPGKIHSVLLIIEKKVWNVNVDYFYLLSVFPHATIKFPIKESTDKTRHATLSKNEDRDFDGCRKEDMIVHTAELGLPTKYIQPEKFNAYQCKGKCSLKQWRKYIIHSLLKAYLEDKKGIKVDNNACCVPTKLRPMSLFYYNETLGFVRHILTDAIVEECGCYWEPEFESLHNNLLEKG